MSKTLVRLAVLVTAVASIGMAGAQPAQAAVTGPLKNGWTHGCLEARNGADVSVVVAPCNGRTTQRWYITGNNIIRNTATNKCLNTRLPIPPFNGVYVKLTACNTSDAGQKWVWGGGGLGTYTFANTWASSNSGSRPRVLDVDLDNPVSSGVYPAFVWTTTRMQNQTWALP